MMIAEPNKRATTEGKSIGNGLHSGQPNGVTNGYHHEGPINGHSNKVAHDVHSGETGVFEPIAIIGFALKFPQDVTCAESFWEMLLAKRSTVTSIPKERWNADAFYKPNGVKSGTVILDPL